MGAKLGIHSQYSKFSGRKNEEIPHFHKKIPRFRWKSRDFFSPAENDRPFSRHCVHTTARSLFISGILFQIRIELQHARRDGKDRCVAVCFVRQGRSQGVSLVEEIKPHEIRSPRSLPHQFQ